MFYNTLISKTTYVFNSLLFCLLRAKYEIFRRCCLLAFYIHVGALLFDSYYMQVKDYCILILITDIVFILERMFVQNISVENDLIFKRMNVQVTCIFIRIVLHKDSLCYSCISLLFIHELDQGAFELGLFKFLII